jgi:hypothetical protein
MSTAQIATGGVPYVTTGKAPPNPRPVPVYRDTWVKRTYQVSKTVATGTQASLKANELGPTVAGDIGFVDKITVWGLNPGSGLSAALNQSTVTDSDLSDPLTVKDFGSATSLPGVTFKVPLGHAKAVDLHDVIVLATADPAITTALLTNNSFVFQVTLWVST